MKNEFVRLVESIKNSIKKDSRVFWFDEKNNRIKGEFLDPGYKINPESICYTPKFNEKLPQTTINAASIFNNMPNCKIITVNKNDSLKMKMIKNFWH